MVLTDLSIEMDLKLLGVSAVTFKVVKSYSTE